MTKGDKKIIKAKALLADYWWLKDRRIKLTAKMQVAEEKILETLMDVSDEDRLRLQPKIDEIIRML